MRINISTLEDEIGLALRGLARNLTSVVQGAGDAGQIADQARNVACPLGDFRALEGTDPDPDLLGASLRDLEGQPRE